MIGTATADTWTWHGGTLHHLGEAWRECLEAAVAAPSIHNTQPWRFRLRSGGVDVFADQSRRLGVIDPSGREVVISVAAAVLNLRVAVLAHGRTPITRLFPYGGEPDLIARVRLGPPVQASDTARLLARAIPRRHTSRLPFSGRTIPDEVRHDLCTAAAVEGGHLTIVDAADTAAVMSLVRAAEMRQHADPDYVDEIAAWTRQWPHRRDGVPPEAYGPSSAMGSLPIRDFGLLGGTKHRKVESFEPDPTVAVLSSPGDTPQDWAVVGQALERVLLTATVRGLATTLLTQPLELPRLRDLLAESATHRVPLAIIRMGYGPPSAATPRRRLADVVDNVQGG